jgi:hypothetical protein
VEGSLLERRDGDINRAPQQWRQKGKKPNKNRPKTQNFGEVQVLPPPTEDTPLPFLFHLARFTVYKFQ